MIPIIPLASHTFLMTHVMLWFSFQQCCRRVWRSLGPGKMA